jgi:ribosomal protein S18 acetylase RimI-like enzyme
MSINKETANFQFEPIKESDLQEFKEFRLKSLLESPDPFGLAYEEAIEKDDRWWQDYLAYDRIFGLKVNDKIIGIVGLYISKGIKKSHVAEITNVYLDPEFRGQKLGKKLIEEMAKIAKGRSVEILKLTVLDNNIPALATYKNLGFEQIGILRKSMKYKDKYLDEILMQKEI